MCGHDGTVQPVFPGNSDPPYTTPQDEIVSSVIDSTGNLIVVGRSNGIAAAARLVLDQPPPVVSPAAPRRSPAPPGVRPLATAEAAIPAPNPGPAGVSFAGAGLAFAHLTLTRTGHVRVLVICPPGAAGTCTGSIAITGESDGSAPGMTGRARRQPIRLAAGRYTARAGHTVATSLRVGLRARRLIGARRTETRALLRLTSRDSAGNSATHDYLAAIRAQRRR